MHSLNLRFLQRHLLRVFSSKFWKDQESCFLIIKKRVLLLNLHIHFHSFTLVGLPWTAWAVGSWLSDKCSPHFKKFALKSEHFKDYCWKSYSYFPEYENLILTYSWEGSSSIFLSCQYNSQFVCESICHFMLQIGIFQEGMAHSKRTTTLLSIYQGSNG